MKYLFDSIWGDILVTPLMQSIIYTPEFQRMRFQKQLGNSNFIFPSANSDRFSHSIGVSHLTRKVCEHLKNLHPRIVKKRQIELLCIAGLVHDIGHGPFSHAFDFIIKDTKTEAKHHEYRSKKIFKYIVKKYNIPLKKEEILFICEAIEPSEVFRQLWQYQIISGTVDTDRMDYILRDSLTSGIPVSINKNQIMRLIKTMSIKNNQIQFNNKAVNMIKGLLSARKEMFVTVYNHKNAVAIDYMMKEIFNKVKHINRYNLEKIVNNTEKFLEIDDTILRQIYYDPEVSKEVKCIIDCIFTGNYYKMEKEPVYKKIPFDVNFSCYTDLNLFSEFCEISLKK